MTLRDWEEMPEEEADRLFDATIRELLRQAKEELKNKPKPAMKVMNPKAIQDVMFAYNAIKELTKGIDAKVMYNIDPDVGRAEIYVKCVSLVVDKPDVFLAVAEKMPYLNASTNVDGTLDFNFDLFDMMIEYDKDGNIIE